MDSAGSSLTIEIPITVKTYDVDFAGIVHNLVYIRWLEDLRFQILADYLPMEQMLTEGITPILVRTTIDYKYPVTMGDTILGRMWVADLGRSRWTVRGQIWNEDKLAADATQNGYFASLETLRPIRIPASLRQVWDTAHDVG